MTFTLNNKPIRYNSDIIQMLLDSEAVTVDSLNIKAESVALVTDSEFLYMILDNRGNCAIASQYRCDIYGWAYQYISPKAENDITHFFINHNDGDSVEFNIPESLYTMYRVLVE